MMNARTAVVVEDDRDVGDAISNLLDQAGFDVVIARTGAEALALISEGQPDLVTLDLTLPDIDGLDVCRKIREERPELPIIMLTARAEEMDVIVGLGAGADDYVP